MNQRIQYVVKNIKGPRVLDVGAASAYPDPQNNKFWLHQHIHKLFPDAIGIDLNVENVRKLQSLGWNNIKVADAEDYEPESLFDTVVAGELIEHLTNPAVFLKKMCSKLAPNGRLIITTPNPFGLLNVGFAVRHYPQTCSHWEHTAWFCPTTIGQLAKRVGYRVASIEFVDDYREAPSLVYRFAIILLTVFGFLIPKVLKCNSFVCVLEVDSSI